MQSAFKLLSISIIALSAAITLDGVASTASATLNVTNDGAGHYGKVSGDVNFAGAGDEHPSMPVDTQGCIICVTKAVHILSLHGAAVTIGDAVGGACDQNGGVTIAKSFATIPFGITTWP